MKFILIIYFNITIFCMLVFKSQFVFSEELTYHLSFEQWSVPRSVNTILTINSISSAIKALQQNTNFSLIIHHPGGDEGSLCATDLRGWLISLGISSEKIKLIPGSSDINQLDLEVVSDNESVLVTE
jgi:hypothetical protein